MPFRSPNASLPLTPTAFEILLALAGADAHGYAILQTVEARLGGRLPLRTGTLYRALARLEETGLIEEIEADPEDQRRRVYRLTPAGHAVVRAEAERLEDQVKAARAHNLLPGHRP
jgi:DNA-binding PadR family transcriptional regulator